MVKKPEKRRAPRVPIESGKGRVKASVPVTVLDISGAGMQLELAAALRPGAIYELAIHLNGFELASNVRITRCRARDFVPDGKGGRLLLYRAGAEFVQLEEKKRLELERWILLQSVQRAMGALSESSERSRGPREG